MKRTFIFLGILLLAGSLSGQELKKGNLVGVHTLTITLNAGVTLEQYIDFYSKNILPAYEKFTPGIKIYFTSGVRGESEGKTGMIVIFPSEKERDRYWNPDGSPTEYNLKLQEELKPMMEKLAKLGTDTFVYTDWLVQ
jgi:ABC-type glycerol-3-phosphate transport system substrate-binding protein